MERLEVVVGYRIAQCFNTCVSVPGHIYCITECGGAMEEVKCPECEARIGGKNHQLRSDNQLAREMDGASYAAWSEQANLLNYEGFARH